ncbi:MAG TPA: ribonuclease III [Alphaproteobacteria bacterium]|nr:ribonuclease III [Alphaproteobacteria bacterium]
MGESAGRLQKHLGHRFDRPALLEEALTHPSVDVRRSGGRNYQRLEFLGDRVLGLVIAARLLAEDPAASEGDLAVRFNALVRRETLAEVALECGLDPFVRLGRSEEEQGGRAKPAILADVCEAVIGALYLDGGLAAAEDFILRGWRRRLARAGVGKDAKTTLQERVQAGAKAPPTYRVTGREGPDHAPHFTVEVTVKGEPPASGEGGSRREAEQAAAQAMLDRLDGNA